MNLDNNSEKEKNNYYCPPEKSHWKKYQLYYLVFGSFFITSLIILIGNSNVNEQIRKINQRLNNQSGTENLKNSRNNNPHNYKSVKYLPRYRIGGQAEPERHALFYGPPGSGKTYLAEMFAKNESLGYIFAKFGTETYTGSSQQKVNGVMEQAQSLLEQNGQDKPVVIIIDEIDSVGVKDPLSRSSTQEVNTILTMIDDIKRDNLNIIVIGITNYPGVLDPALKRTGRLGRQIKVPYLAKEEITKMVNYLEKDMKKEQQITQEAFEKCRQAEIGISYTDLEMSIKDALAKEVSKDSKKITPQSSDYQKELEKKVADKAKKEKERNPMPTPDKEKEDNS
ncbi:5939_t:CDS:2 [Ambispora gerdemannii]|uniref:5939_t:CDS:1 n=1 Tax=Ambispora gerdemannii TaxID=144530 RepID=A0A9N8UXY9_9GLOM|nr:5939_t:CDS:2 [Ambispora gerdemannii]